MLKNSTNDDKESGNENNKKKFITAAVLKCLDFFHLSLLHFLSRILCQHKARPGNCIDPNKGPVPKPRNDLIPPGNSKSLFYFCYLFSPGFLLKAIIHLFYLPTENI